MSDSCARNGRCWRRAALLLAALVLLPSPAWAHGDANPVAGTLTIPPDGSSTAREDVHWHRLVGIIEADGPVTLELRRVGTAGTVLDRGPAERIVVNELIACCDGPWTPHELTIHNPGDRSVVVDADLTFVHDDLAVMVHMAESGTRESVIVLGAAWAALLWWSVRRRRLDPTLRSAVARLATVTAVIGGMSLIGWLRYGVAGAPALIGALGSIPVIPTNPIVSRASLLIFVAMLGWGAAGLRWAGAHRPAGTSTPHWTWLAVGGLLIASVLATALLVTDAYGRWGMAAAAALVASLPLVVVMAAGRRHPAQEG